MDTATRQQIEEAFLEVSRTAARKTIYALRAEQNGRSQLAKLFRAIALSEKAQALRLLIQLRGRTGTNQENCWTAFEEEAPSLIRKYEEAARIAENAGERGMQSAFSQSSRVQRMHLSLKKKLDEDQAKDKPSATPAILLIIGGLILLSGGSDIFIRGATDVARNFGVSELIIGLTLAAIGTSLPELASSLSAIRRKETALLIGNVIGSNMFNLFMVLGLTGIIAPFELSKGLLYRDIPVMIAFTLVLLPILHHPKGTSRWHGILFLSAYIGYYFLLL